MPRIFKGTETLLKLFVPRVDEGNIETLKIGLFTDDTNNAAEFYGDNMSIDGDTVYLKVNAWSFDMMNDGVLNYIAEIEIGEETIITERQSNYFLKTPNQYVPVGPDLSDYYTKPEIDEMLEDIEVDVDLTGYATEQWVEDKTYATEQYVNDAIANIDIPEGGSGEQEVYIEELAEQITSEQFYRIYELSQSGKIVLVKYDGGIYPISSLDYVNIKYKYFSFFETKAETLYYVVYAQPSTDYTKCIRHRILNNGKVFNFIYLNNGRRLSKFALDDVNSSLIPVIWGDNKLIPLNLDKKNQIASAIIGDKLYKWDFVNGEIGVDSYCSAEIIELGNSGGSGDADLSNYYTKEETDNLIANSSVMLETTLDGVLTYSQIRTIRNNWANAYINVYWQDNSTTMNKYVAITSLYINDALADNKNIHLEGICEGYLYTWDIKGNNTEGVLVRTPISAGGAAKAIVVETEMSGSVYTDKLAYSKLAIIQENIGNVYIRGNLNTESTDINDAVVTNITYHPMFDMLGVGTCKVTAMNATNVYTWTFTNKTTQVSPTITPISSGGGSTPSTETDSGVYVLDYVGEYQIMYEENNWDAVTNHVYAESERQEHNAEIYQAWKEGKIKALYYKHVENTFVEYGKTLQYQLVPCTVRWEDETENNGMAVTALYKRNNYFDTTDIHSAMFSLNEDGSLRGDYVESYHLFHEEINICDAYYYDGEGFRLDSYVPINYIGGGWRSCEVELVSETTRERVSLNYIISNDYWTENNSTATLYGTLSNGSIIKWDFSAQNGTIIDEYTFAQIIPMEVDLSSYYTKEEVDALIANINLGDGATIESIVANEVANQLTDNFKTINGESILGEGDITIQGGSSYEVYTIEGRNMTTDEWNEINNNLRNGIPCYISYSNQYNIYGWASYNEFSASISVTTAKEQAIWFQYGGVEFYSLENTGGGSGNIGELYYPTITSPTIVGEMTFNDEQLPHEDISESVYCNFKARKTQSKDLWVNNIHIGTNTDTIKIASPYYESTENMSDGAQEVYAEFTTEGIKENGKYLEEKYAGKGFITHPNNIGNYGYEDSAIVAYGVIHLEKAIVAKAWAENKALFVTLGGDVKKQIPVSIETKYNSDLEITGYEVWGWYSKTQTITWVFGKDSTSVTPTIE